MQCYDLQLQSERNVEVSLRFPQRTDLGRIAPVRVPAAFSRKWSIKASNGKDDDLLARIPCFLSSVAWHDRTCVWIQVVPQKTCEQEVLNHRSTTRWWSILFCRVFRCVVRLFSHTTLRRRWVDSGACCQPIYFKTNMSITWQQQSVSVGEFDQNF